MTAPSLLDELEGVVRAYDAGTDDADAADKALMFVLTRRAEIADMAKRLEAAERDAARWRMARNNTGDGLRLVRWNHEADEELQVMFPSPVLCDSDADTAIDAAHTEAGNPATEQDQQLAATQEGEG